MVSSDDPPEESGCLVFRIEGLCIIILKSLPAKSLCRFRCVCRSWNSLITSPSFVAEHFSFVSSASEKSYLLFSGFDRYRGIHPLYHPYQNQVTYLDPPFQARMLGVTDVIHGVVCLASPVKNPGESTVLWNPSTHKYLSIPRSHPDRLNYRRSIGFGFQSSKNGYKVVTISCHPQGLEPPVFEVFSLQTGLWMAVASDGSTVSSFRCVMNGSCFLTGTIHWIALFPSFQGGGNRRFALLCFDCEHDKLSKMELPHELSVSPPMKILRYGGKLSVYRRTCLGSFELWVMDEYGVVSTWSRLFIIGRPTDVRSIVMRGEDGDIMVYDDVQALAKKTRKRLRNRKRYLPVIAGVLEESLYSLEQASQVQRQ